METFHVLDLQSQRPTAVSAVLRYVSPNAYFYVQEGLSVQERDLERSAVELEERIIPAVHRYINPGWDPGAGIDSRITILHARLRGAAGFVTSLDLYSRDIWAFSNQRPMVYIGVGSTTPGTDRYYAVLAHELQHVAHAQADPSEEVWVTEGASELLAELAGYPVGLYNAFIVRPDTQLTSWSDQSAGTAPHYGAAHLFLKYIGARYGGYDQFSELITNTETGIDGVEAFLEQQGAEGGFDAAFKDWAIANYLESSPGSKFAYPGRSFRVNLAGTVGEPGEYRGQVRQYAADYIDLQSGDAERQVTFQGGATAPILPTDPPSGDYLWWSNQGDSIDSTLTRRFDLSGVSQATLMFKLWHDIEAHFDYAYVEASGDGGATGTYSPGRIPATRTSWARASAPPTPAAAGEGLPPGGWRSPWTSPLTPAGRPWSASSTSPTRGATTQALPSTTFPSPRSASSTTQRRTPPGSPRGSSGPTTWCPSASPSCSSRSGMNPACWEMPLDAENRGQAPLPSGSRTVLVVAAMAPVTTVAAEYTYTVE